MSVGAHAPGTPGADGLAMPAEWSRHERTLMAWPARPELWGGAVERARAEYAATANAIAEFEPVLMVAGPGRGGEARAALTRAVEVIELPIDDSWLRDNGPVFVTGDGGARAAVDFGFNAWGERYHPYDLDAALGALVLEHLDVARYVAPMVLEGGSIAVDGEGVLLTTEQCLLHPNRNPDLDREAIERHLRDYLGARRIVWLGRGLAEDRDTDGHVDLIAAFTAPGSVLLQTVRDERDPNFTAMRENRARLDAAGLAVTELDLLPHAQVEGETLAVSYLNLYLCNGAAIVPVSGAPEDGEALSRIGAALPGREVVPVPGLVLAYGGGGPHCITQQVPAVP